MKPSCVIKFSLIGGGIYLLARFAYQTVTYIVKNRCKLSKLQSFQLLLWGPDSEFSLAALELHLASTQHECAELLQTLKRQAESDGFVGFDCEWVSGEPVALIQLATKAGYCIIVHLSKIGTIPAVLKNLLEDETLFKVGVGATNDAKLILRDYQVMTKGCVDIRFFAPLRNKMGLAALAKDHLNISLDKSLHIRRGNWSADTLTEDQLRYAGQDAFAGGVIFAKLIADKINQAGSSEGSFLVNMRSIAAPYVGVHFSPATEKVFSGLRQTNKTVGGGSDTTKAFRAYTPRKTPMYSNCKMLAPDGEVLCTCSRKKADWYVKQGLGVVVCSEPYRIQLLFEPAERFHSPSGQYYTQDKVNQCVVCGEKDSHLRKNVVPHEYRRHFPDKMKKRQSHDVLPVCQPCHQRSNLSDVSLRQQLGEQCNAPVGAGNDIKATDDVRLKKLRSAARALLRGEKQISDSRRDQLLDVIKEIVPYYEEGLRSQTREGDAGDAPSLQHLSLKELLPRLKDIDICVPNMFYIPHGLKVTEQFAKDGVSGLRELERIWRQHFIDTMNPQFLPPLWSVSHHLSDRGCPEDETFRNKMKMVKDVEESQH